MAICTKCGTIINLEDKHVCNPADVPAKGFVKIPVTSSEAIKDV